MISVLSRHNTSESEDTTSGSGRVQIHQLLGQKHGSEEGDVAYLNRHADRFCRGGRSSGNSSRFSKYLVRDTSLRRLQL